MENNTLEDLVKILLRKREQLFGVTEEDFKELLLSVPGKGVGSAEVQKVEKRLKHALVPSHVDLLKVVNGWDCAVGGMRLYSTDELGTSSSWVANTDALRIYLDNSVNIEYAACSEDGELLDLYVIAADPDVQALLLASKNTGKLVFFGDEFGQSFNTSEELISWCISSIDSGEFLEYPV